MPRIYAPNEDYTNDWAGTPAYRGVAVVPEGTNVDWFDDNGFAIDNSKHARSLLDNMTPAELRIACGYMKLTIDQGVKPDTKQALVRALETELSTKYIGAVVVASAAGDAAGDTKITITGAGTYKYKTAKTTAPAILYMDFAGADWTDIATGDQFEPTAQHDKITVAEINDDGYVVAVGTATITVNN